ncbi:putative ABC transport system ATP-binding protein [Austwickia chelonae]|uniref:Putative ABC transporter ATP-binding protein n=1 Tax=Austwickia chelonae NBRC 105200 TaxID=1184607 RepID=K6VN96_9MICO|nr:ABC transporter ATP-binding protein [Austwickia chelonae]GAB78194.1 putative ABC transporter ATP-binding protein [Austwickia chelonae NBRC 105200]SEV98509.1 putative ABC transport system ATP-binding protein [Austwickia chelonae]
MVSVRDVTKSYALGKTTIAALAGVSVDIDEGQFVAIGGPSGSGKSTLLNIIGCIDRPTSGQVEIDGRLTDQMSERELDELRLHKIGFIFQGFNLISALNVYENIELPLLIHRGVSSAERRQRVNFFIEKVGLSDRAKNRADELSGGQRQRVAIARALVTRPGIVLADEPTANLDTHTGLEIINLMHAMSREEGTSFLFSTHDAKVMSRADRLIQLEDGRIVEEIDDVMKIAERARAMSGVDRGAAAVTAK